MRSVGVRWVRGLVTVLGLGLPVIPILLFLVFFYLPKGLDPYVISLGGRWELKSGTISTNVELPGLFLNAGVSSFDAEIQRKIVLKDGMLHEDLFLTVFGTIFQTGLVYMNGYLVGEIGSYGQHRKLGNIQGMDGFYIHQELLSRSSGTNTVRIVLQTEDKQSFGIQDPRFYLGVSRVLKPYFEKNLIVNNLFLYGILFFSLFTLILMIILSVSGWAGGFRQRYIATGNYILFTFLFNLLFSGVFISYVLPLDFLMVTLDAVIVLFVLANMEFVQYYYLNRINRFGIANRIVCLIAFGAYAVNYLFFSNNNDVVNIIYNIFSGYVMLSFGYSLYLILRTVVGKKIGYGTIIAFPVLMTLMTGVSDLLSNFGIIKFPLVFSVTASSVSIIATIVIIADFIDMGNRNIKLSKFLRKSNENLRNLIRELRKKKLMEYDMSMASKIQAALLPQKFPGNESVEISGGSIPAKLVGGDYYDVIPIDDHRYLCAIADVMGKGMSASLVMVKVQTLLRALSGEGIGLFEMAERINGIISGEFLGERFVTLSLLMYDGTAKKAEFILFGHEPVMVYRKATQSIELYKNENMPLGIEDRLVSSGSRLIDLLPGDRIVLFTDGVTEAQNDGEEFFGMERFKLAVLESANEDIHAFIPRIIGKVGQFRGTAEQSDDITLLIIEVK